jgi:transcriptional regulator GlxA family with amidase domain
MDATNGHRIDRANGGGEPIEIAIPIDHGLTATDAICPYEILRFIPGATVKFVAETPGPKLTDSRMLTVVADYAFADVPRPDVIVVPAADFRPSLANGSFVAWLRAAHETSRWTTSVCGGATLLGIAGLLQGKRATTHWMAVDGLAAFGALPQPGARWVVDGKIVTAAGNSAGIDMALWLTGQLAGDLVARGAQLAAEYDPAPPYDAGSPEKAGPEVAAWARARAAQIAADLGLDLADPFGTSASVTAAAAERRA